MKHASWVIAGCLLAGGMMSQPVFAQSGTSAPPNVSPCSHDAAWIKDPNPAQVKAAWGDPDDPNKSHSNAWIKDPNPAQVKAAWGDPADPNKSHYNAWIKDPGPAQVEAAWGKPCK
jgi:hypothetical protein